jgi:hypothetical protein
MAPFETNGPSKATAFQGVDVSLSSPAANDDRSEILHDGNGHSAAISNNAGHEIHEKDEEDKLSGSPKTNLGSSPVSSANCADTVSTKASSLSENMAEEHLPARNTTGPLFVISHAEVLTETTENGSSLPIEAGTFAQDTRQSDKPSPAASDIAQSEEITIHIDADLQHAATLQAEPDETQEAQPGVPEVCVSKVSPFASTSMPVSSHDTSEAPIAERASGGVGKPIVVEPLIALAAERDSRRLSASTFSSVEGDANSVYGHDFVPPRRHDGSRRKKRGITIQPIRTDVSADNSDDNLLSDDSLMEELNSATVQEAKPVSVGKSPLTPGFPAFSGPRTSSTPTLVRQAASNPNLSSKSLDDRPVVSAMVATHASTAGNSPRPEHVVVGTHEKRGPIAIIKKVNVSSGISQRIKALERVSSQGSSASIVSQAGASASPAAVTVSNLRKASLPVKSTASQTRKFSEPVFGATAAAENTAHSALHGGDPRPLGRVQAKAVDVKPLHSPQQQQQQQQQQQPQAEVPSLETQIVRDIKDYHLRKAQGGQGHSQNLAVDVENICNSSSSAAGAEADAPSAAVAAAAAATDADSWVHEFDDTASVVRTASSVPISASSSPVGTRRPSVVTVRSASSRDAKPAVASCSPLSAVEPASPTSRLVANGIEVGGGEDGKGDGKRGPQRSRLLRQVSITSSTSSRSMSSATGTGAHNSSVSLSVSPNSPTVSLSGSSPPAAAATATVDKWDTSGVLTPSSHPSPRRGSVPVQRRHSIDMGDVNVQFPDNMV